MPPFGPLFDGAVVDFASLAGLVRETAINAGNMIRTLKAYYQTLYPCCRRRRRVAASCFHSARLFEVCSQIVCFSFEFRRVQFFDTIYTNGGAAEVFIWLLVMLNRFHMEQGHCGACRREWQLTDTDLCPCGETQTMSHIVESCPLTKLNGGLSRLQSADEDAVSWLTNYS